MDCPNCSSNAKIEEIQEEMIRKTIAQQEAKRKTYDLLKEQGLPIPLELEKEIGEDGNANRT